MAKQVIEQLAGTIDGTNRIFQTSAPYLPGSIVVFRNGQARPPTTTDGWVELGNKKIEMNEAPEAGDVISAYYSVT